LLSRYEILINNLCKTLLIFYYCIVLKIFFIIKNSEYLSILLNVKNEHFNIF